MSAVVYAVGARGGGCCVSACAGVEVACHAVGCVGCCEMGESCLGFGWEEGGFWMESDADADGLQVAANAESIGADLSKGFVVGGFSGGAIFASIINYLARDDGLECPITGVFLSCPAFTVQVEDRTGRMAVIRAVARTPIVNANTPGMSQQMCDRISGE